MEFDGVQNLLDALASALAVPVVGFVQLPRAIQQQVQAVIGPGIGEIRLFSVAERRYLGCRYHQRHQAVLVLGPYRIPSDPPVDIPTLDDAAKARAIDAVRSASQALQTLVEIELQRIALANQLEVTSRSVLAITSELGLDTVLNRIVDLARELSGARFAALGVPGADGDLESFLTSGMSAEEEAQIPHRPRGLGLLGLLLREPRTLRLKDLHQHPASAGFPANHPPMKSFLGVPIMSHGQMLGNLYLTEKRTADEFTDDDARLVEVLARHAAVAIENARLYHQLDRQQQRLRLILDQLPEATLLIESDPERVTLANQHAVSLLGWEIELPLLLDDFLRRNIRFAHDDAELPAAAIAMVRSLRHGESVSRMEERIERPDGRRITTLVNSVPLMGHGNRVTGAIVVFQDITQIKDAEQLKDDFLSLVSHELRTPLTTIQVGALMLQRDWAALDLATQQETLADIAVESHRLGSLIENMVQLANIRAGRAQMETGPMLVDAFVQQAIAAVRVLAPDRVFHADVEHRLLAEADEDQVDQVLRNLLQNAVKYSPANAAIDVRARRAGDSVEFSVRDYGTGIDASELQLVFDRFHRTESSRSSNAPGMGLGLYLSRHVVEAHGGAIWIERPDDGGTRMLFTLPAIQDEG